jgi:hypothetical protein
MAQQNISIETTFKVKSVLNRTRAQGLANMRVGDTFTIRHTLRKTYGGAAEFLVINHQTSETSVKYEGDLINALAAYEVSTVRNYIMKAKEVPTA